MFTTSLDVRKVGRDTWMLLSELQYFCKLLNCNLIVPTGFISDFASIPRIAQILFPKVDYYDPAAVIHDWLYKMQTYSRKTSDRVFREACIYGCSIGHFRAGIMYRELRTWGWITWNKHVKV